MKIIVQIKFGSGKQKIESFGSDRYLVYLNSTKDDPGAMAEFTSMMAKYMTIPPGRIHYKGKHGESYIFEVD